MTSAFEVFRFSCPRQRTIYFLRAIHLIGWSKSNQAFALFFMSTRNCFVSAVRRRRSIATDVWMLYEHNRFLASKRKIISCQWTFLHRSFYDQLINSRYFNRLVQDLHARSSTTMDASVVLLIFDFWLRAAVIICHFITSRLTRKRFVLVACRQFIFASSLPNFSFKCLFFPLPFVRFKTSPSSFVSPKRRQEIALRIYFATQVWRIHIVRIRFGFSLIEDSHGKQIKREA